MKRNNEEAKKEIVAHITSLMTLSIPAWGETSACWWKKNLAHLPPSTMNPNPATMKTNDQCIWTFESDGNLDEYRSYSSK